jgi:hypothetical protein
VSLAARAALAIVAAPRKYQIVFPGIIRAAMDSRSSIAGVLAFALCATLGAGCSTPQTPAAIPPPAPVPVVATAPVKRTPDPLMQDWNIFPDPTTGKVEVYHKGAYVGAVTGDEPESEDPPVPHNTGE